MGISKRSIAVVLIVVLGFLLIPAQERNLEANAINNPEITTNGPKIKDMQGKVLTYSLKGQLVLVSMNIRNRLGHDQSFVLILEARDSKGVTQFLAFSFGTLKAGAHEEVGISWTPEIGNYELRSFLITSFEESSVLSRVSTNEAAVYDPLHISPVITLQMTVCFGSCPSYSLTIWGDGEIEYHGNSYVAVKGNQTATIPKEDVQTLLYSANEIGYFDLKDDYAAPVSDAPSYITSLTMNGTTKKILDAGSAPASLMEFEDLIDYVAGTDRWIKCPDGQRIMEPNGACT